MYEKLDRLREDLKNAERRKKSADERLKLAQDRLKEAESAQILSDVGALNLTPEQVAKFLQMAARGQLGGVPAAAEEKAERKAEIPAAEETRKEDETIDRDDEWKGDDADA